MVCVDVRRKHRDFRCFIDIKINRRSGIESSERFSDCRCQNLPYSLFVFKLYLTLGRMDIDIYRLGINSQIYK